MAVPARVWSPICAIAFALGCSDSSDGNRSINIEVPTGGAAGAAGSNVGGTTNTGGSSTAGSANQGGSASGSAGQSTGGQAGNAATAGSGGSVQTNALAFVSPTEGQTFSQMGIPALTTLPLSVSAGTAIASVSYSISGGATLGSSTVAPNFALSPQIDNSGDLTLIANGIDSSGASIATTEVSVHLDPAPSGMSCLDTLTWLGVDWTATEARGVVDAIHVHSEINGVLFANGTNDEPMGDPVACEFMKTLWQFANVLKERNIHRVGTLGSYCYRCCCSWSDTNYCRGPNDPEPDCSANGYSNHSWGRAVDVRYLYRDDGVIFDVNDPTHWVISTAGDTCVDGIAEQSGMSLEMYSIACQVQQGGFFKTILTPNYNDAHRNHWHMDIGETGTPTTTTIHSIDAHE